MQVLDSQDDDAKFRQNAAKIAENPVLPQPGCAKQRKMAYMCCTEIKGPEIDYI